MLYERADLEKWFLSVSRRACWRALLRVGSGSIAEVSVGLSGCSCSSLCGEDPPFLRLLGVEVGECVGRLVSLSIVSDELSLVRTLVSFPVGDASFEACPVPSVWFGGTEVLRT